MKYQILLVTILFAVFFSTGCKKEIKLDVQDTICDLSTPNHINHDEFQTILTNYATQGIVGITAVLSKPGTETWIGSAGYASIENEVKMNPCHLHHTASLTKSFTAVVILQLIEEGKLSLDTKLSTYIDESFKQYIPNYEAITIQHLLQQTSGIPDIFGVEFFTALMNDPEKIYTTEELLAFNEDKDALSEVGIQHHYSDPNYMLLAMIIDELEGSHINAFGTRILDPINLQNVHYHDANYPLIAGVSSSYWEQYEDGLVENISDVQNNLTSYILGSDGIIGSPKDMTHFYQSVFEGNLLEESTLEMITTNTVVEEDENRINSDYSHGFMVIKSDDETWIGHAGLQIGASCYVFYNLETRVTIGVFTNIGTFLSEEKKALVYYDLWNELREVME